jgi:hypothetical protein
LKAERNCHEGLPGIEMKMEMWTVRQRPGQILKIKVISPVKEENGESENNRKWNEMTMEIGLEQMEV